SLRRLPPSSSHLPYTTLFRSIAERFIEVGQYVRQDSKVASIVSVDPIRLELAVPEAEVAKVAQGAVVTFGVSAYPGRRFSGKVRDRKSTRLNSSHVKISYAVF